MAAKCPSNCSVELCASSNEGDLTLDPFAGSGTTLAVAKKLRCKWIGFELSAEDAALCSKCIESVKIGDALNGPIDPLVMRTSNAWQVQKDTAY